LRKKGFRSKRRPREKKKRGHSKSGAGDHRARCAIGDFMTKKRQRRMIKKMGRIIDSQLPRKIGGHGRKEKEESGSGSEESQSEGIILSSFRT